MSLLVILDSYAPAVSRRYYGQVEAVAGQGAISVNVALCQVWFAGSR